VLTIRVIAVGKDKDAWVSDGCAHYEKLLSRWAQVHWQFVKPGAISASFSPDQIKAREADDLVRALRGRAYIALTDGGKKLDSLAFSRQLQKWLTSSGGELTFVIGGAYGLDSQLEQKAQIALSLSPLTFSHQLVRLVLLEQLYRGFSILHNTEYHK
jgi:23S rRNA (pseudouridine1915-N3)-methyltransferase